MNPQDYLHLYMGCKVKFPRNGQVWTMVANPADIQNEISYSIAVKMGVQPILRPLSSMTEEEETEYSARVDKWNFGFRRNMRGAASSTHYLLSKHFDVFGLIEAGLAIDSTQVNETENF